MRPIPYLQEDNTLDTKHRLEFLNSSKHIAGSYDAKVDFFFEVRQILAIMSKDENDNTYPITFIVDYLETKDTWT